MDKPTREYERTKKARQYARYRARTEQSAFAKWRVKCYIYSDCQKSRHVRDFFWPELFDGQAHREIEARYWRRQPRNQLDRGHHPTQVMRNASTTEKQAQYAQKRDHCEYQVGRSD